MAFTRPDRPAHPEDYQQHSEIRQELIVPVIAEELQAGIRQVKTGGIRVHKTIHEHDEVLDQPLQVEEVEVRRVIKNEVVDGPLPVRQVGDITIVPVVKEVLKIEKQWILTEEIHLVKGRREQRGEQRVTIRREQAAIERIDAEGRSLGAAVIANDTPAAETQLPETSAVRPKYVRKNKVIK